ncbi:hypothetical protein ACJX0J_013962, partial [Zea mays]
FVCGKKARKNYIRQSNFYFILSLWIVATAWISWDKFLSDIVAAHKEKGGGDAEEDEDFLDERKKSAQQHKRNHSLVFFFFLKILHSLKLFIHTRRTVHTAMCHTNIHHLITARKHYLCDVFYSLFLYTDNLKEIEGN